MIRGFADNEAEKIVAGIPSKRLPADIQAVARRKLRMLNNAFNLTDPRVPPANRLEGLKGDRKGQYSIRINDQCESAFDGTKAMPTMSRSSTITDHEETTQHSPGRSAP
jgi:proteic killer suppression protein